MEKKRALILGSTGLVGNHLTKVLEASGIYSDIRLPVRKPRETDSEILTEFRVDFNHLPAETSLWQVEDIFCCIGTTMKAAGSKEAFRKVDFDIPVQVAALASGHIKRFFLVSSIGANPASWNFYLKTKGETEKKILETAIESVFILRPSMLLGDRRESRTGEKIGKVLTSIASPLLFGRWKKYRGIQAQTVAEAMLKLAESEKKGRYFFESDDIKRLVTGAATPAKRTPTI